MKNQLPEYVFEKKFDKYYLQTEFDIIFNEFFSRKLNTFLEHINYKNLSIKLDIDNRDSIPIKILSPLQLNEVYDMEILIGSENVPLFMIDFFISDNFRKWEIYVSLENELSIIACDNEVSCMLEVILKPYEDEDFEQKCKIIGDKFDNKKFKNDFINILKNNYKFNPPDGSDG